MRQGRLSRRMARLQFAGIVLAVLLPLPFLPASIAGTLHMDLTADKLTVRAEQVPLQTILKRINQMGVTVRVDPEINPLISVSFQDQDLEKGLASLLKSVNHIFVWDTMEGPMGPMQRLVEIQVFRPGRKELMKPLGTRRGLAIARNPKDGSLYVQQELFVRLAPGVGLAEFKKLLQEIGGTVVDAVPEIGVYRIVLPQGADVPSMVERIKEDPRVQRAEPNYAYPVAAPHEYLNAGLSDYPPSTPSQERGSAPIAILDTGLSATWELEEFVLASMDTMGPGEAISDPLGHGTQMALIASGAVRPDGAGPGAGAPSPIIPIKTFDENGYTSNYHIMRGIDFALKNNARVMSLSWGTETRSAFLEDSLAYASSKGVILVASAGNEPTGKPVYPAAFSFVIGVGALKPDGSAWEKSNYGYFVVVWAPGIASMPVGYRGGPGAYAGTSISAAYAANVIAGYLSQKPNASIQEVLQGISGRGQ